MSHPALPIPLSPGGHPVGQIPAQVRLSIATLHSLVNGLEAQILGQRFENVALSNRLAEATNKLSAITAECKVWQQLSSRSMPPQNSPQQRFEIVTMNSPALNMNTGGAMRSVQAPAQQTLTDEHADQSEANQQHIHALEAHVKRLEQFIKENITGPAVGNVPTLGHEMDASNHDAVKGSKEWRPDQPELEKYMKPTDQSFMRFLRNQEATRQEATNALIAKGPSIHETASPFSKAPSVPIVIRLPPSTDVNVKFDPEKPAFVPSRAMAVNATGAVDAASNSDANTRKDDTPIPKPDVILAQGLHGGRENDVAPTTTHSQSENTLPRHDNEISGQVAAKPSVTITAVEPQKPSALPLATNPSAEKDSRDKSAATTEIKPTCPPHLRCLNTSMSSVAEENKLHPSDPKSPSETNMTEGGVFEGSSSGQSESSRPSKPSDDLWELQESMTAKEKTADQHVSQAQIDQWTANYAAFEKKWKYPGKVAKDVKQDDFPAPDFNPWVQQDKNDDADVLSEKLSPGLHVSQGKENEKPAPEAPPIHPMWVQILNANVRSRPEQDQVETPKLSPSVVPPIKSPKKKKDVAQTKSQLCPLEAYGNTIGKGSEAAIKSQNNTLSANVFRMESRHIFRPNLNPSNDASVAQYVTDPTKNSEILERIVSYQIWKDDDWIAVIGKKGSVVWVLDDDHTVQKWKNWEPKTLKSGKKFAWN